MKSKIVQGCADLIRTGLSGFATKVLAQFGAQIATGKIVAAGSSGSVIKTTLAHGITRGQRIVFTSGAYIYQEFSFVSAPTTTSLQVDYDFGATPPSALDTFDVLIPTTPRLSSGGGITTSDTSVLAAVEPLSLELITGNIIINAFRATNTGVTLFTASQTGVHKFEVRQNQGLDLIIKKNAGAIGYILPGGSKDFFKSLNVGETIGLSVVSNATGLGKTSWNVHY